MDYQAKFVQDFMTEIKVISPKNILDEEDKREYCDMLAKALYNGEFSDEQTLNYLGDIFQDQAIKDKIFRKMVELKKKYNEQEQNFEKQKNENRVAEKIQKPKKKVKTDQTVQKPEEKIPQSQENLEKMQKKKGLKQELENKGAQKCRFFPFCKNTETCGFFHPTDKQKKSALKISQKIIKNYKKQKKLSKMIFSLIKCKNIYKINYSIDVTHNIQNDYNFSVHIFQIVDMVRVVYMNIKLVNLNKNVSNLIAHTHILLKVQYQNIYRIKWNFQQFDEIIDAKSTSFDENKEKTTTQSPKSRKQTRRSLMKFIILTFDCLLQKQIQNLKKKIQVEQTEINYKYLIQLYSNLKITRHDITNHSLREKMFQARMQECAMFKKIIDSIKDLVKMVNIDATSKGLSIQAMDSCHVALVSLHLKQKAFSYYVCPKPQTLGLAIQSVSKILKIAGSDDSITLQCEQDPSHLKFKFQSKRGDKISDFSLSLMNLDSENLGIPQTDFSSICSMPSMQFSRVCRELGSFSETIKIQTSKQYIKFSVFGDIGNGSAVFNEKNTGNDDSVILNVDQNVILNFAARYLNLFSKAAALSPQVTLNLENQTPLMVEYQLSGNIGELKFYLAPKITEEQ